MSAGRYQEGGYTFDGEWQQDQMHGTGAFTYASGAKYEGSWEQGQYQGQGAYCWPDGRKYEVLLHDTSAFITQYFGACFAAC